MSNTVTHDHVFLWAVNIDCYTPTDFTGIVFFCVYRYSSIQMKCQGGNKYALSITVKFDQSTRRFGKISFARLFKFTKHIALLFYLLSLYLLSCMRGSRNVRTNMPIIRTIMKFCAHWSGHRLRYGEFSTPVGFELSKPGLRFASEAHN